MKKHIPNILTYGRLGLCLVMFAGFAALASLLTGRSPGVAPGVLAGITVVSFIVASVTDFLDGYLARKWNVTSITGAILDPIADKVLVCGAVLGLCVVSPVPELLLPGGVILFREFAVSALREVLAPKGIRLPVTFLAKTKTTLQLAALAFLMIVIFQPLWRVEEGLLTAPVTLNAAKWFYYIAAAVTVWTGVEYGLAAKKALKGYSAA
jgi:CDP-diacylglycerol--glycerol-3-phosphate 3-phosphatidyltransferase